MEPFFTEPHELAMPPDKIRFEHLHLEPHPNGSRLFCRFEVTPFLEKPNFEIELYNPENKLVSSMSIVENLEHRFELTLHLRGEVIPGTHTLKAAIYYTDLSHYEIAEDQSPEEAGPPKQKIVDSIERQLEIITK